MTFGRKNSDRGRRIAQRKEVASSALLGTLHGWQNIVIIDVSQKGARVRGSEVPPKGEDAVLKLGSITAFGEVAWSKSDQCGINFDAPITPAQVHALQADRELAKLARQTEEQQLACVAWKTGLAR